MRIQFVPLDLSLAKKGSDDATLCYVIDDALRKCCRVFWQRFISDEPDCFQNMVNCFLSSELRGRIAFIECSKREFVAKGDRKVSTILLLKHNFCNAILDLDGTEERCITKQMFFNKVDALDILRPFYIMLMYMRARFQYTPARTNIGRIKPSVWIQYDDSFDSFVDTAFWRKSLSKRGFDIVYYLDRSDTPCSDEITKRIEENGYNWIDLHKALHAVPKEDLSLSGILKRMMHNCFKKGPLWLRLFRLQYEEKLFMHRVIYKHFSTKMLVQNLDTYWGQEVQARAVEAAGGVLMGFHWSNYPCIMTPLHLFPHHIFFVWGQIIRDNLESGDHTCRHILPSGVWIGADAKGNNEQLEKFRAEHSFILSVFDSSAAYNIHQTPSTLSEFILGILGFLERYSSWAVVLKSKNQELKEFGRLPAGEKIVSGLMKLKEDGRAMVPGAAMSPVTVARYTDLSVCYGLNSAGIVVGSHGFRAVHWDCSGWKKHPFYRHPEESIIFETLETLEEAIVRASRGDTSVGNFSLWQRSFNHFPGGDAIKRISEFVRNYMEHASAGENGSAALDLAVDHFVQVNDVAESFFRSSFSWD